ncbi:MAG: hypothetical protein NVS3B26_22670 [Mycobacteriales bacterium]
MTRPRPARTTGERFAVVYQRPDCEQRFLDEQRCPDCQLFCRRIDRGGNCPHCDELVAINDLTTNTEENLGH